MQWINSDIVYASCWVPRAGLELAQESMIEKGPTTVKTKNENTAKNRNSEIMFREGW